MSAYNVLKSIFTSSYTDHEQNRLSPVRNAKCFASEQPEIDEPLRFLHAHMTLLASDSPTMD